MIESSFVIPSLFKIGQKGIEHEDEVLWWAHECMKRILEVTPRDKFELIIVDNGSDNFSATDDDGKEISTEGYFDYANVLIRHKENLGYGGGMNAGIKEATGKYVFCLNNDVLPFPNWYEELIKTFDIKGVGSAHPWSIGCRGMRRARDLIKYDDPNLVYKGKRMYEFGKEWGGVYVIPRNLLEEIKERDGFYFDPQFGLAFCEDKDLYKRIRISGYETCRNYKSVVYHCNSTTASKLPSLKVVHKKNKELLHKKWDNK